MAAGQGFKTFTTGEVLTAGDVNGYLMQGINVFTNATARDAAITAPAEGQFAFTKDNNSLWYYDGAAWVASGATGDIEGVTAGVGISGGGTSGTVTVTNSMATAIDAKGDLVPGTGADTFARLPVGANNTVLTADSSTATGLKWAAAGGAGKILQVVTATTSTQTALSSSSYADISGMSVTITPSSTSSRIMIFWASNVFGLVNSYSDCVLPTVNMQLLRGATVISADNKILTGSTSGTGGTAFELIAAWSYNWIDSPSSTSALTYKFQAQRTFPGGNASVALGASSYNQVITAFEIGA